VVNQSASRRRNHRLGVEASRVRTSSSARGGVLRFVQNHERIIQRSPAHKRQRATSMMPSPENAPVCPRQHVVQRVVQRPHVRIDFCCSVPGRKPAARLLPRRRARMMRFICLSAARSPPWPPQVGFPVPPGPNPNVSRAFRSLPCTASGRQSSVLPSSSERRVRPSRTCARRFMRLFRGTRISDFTSVLESIRPCRVSGCTPLRSAPPGPRCLLALHRQSVSCRFVRTCSEFSSSRRFSSRVPKKGSIFPVMCIVRLSSWKVALSYGTGGDGSPLKISAGRSPNTEKLHST